MAYAPQTWTDGAAGGTPLSAARLTHMEDGIEAALAAFNVHAYGAVGDGSTDDSGAFADAIDAAAAAGGGVVYAPAPSYRLDSALTVSGVTDIEIRGAGREATELLCTAGFIDASNNSDRWTVRDLYVRCTTTTNTSNGIVVDYPRRWVISGCRLDGFGGSSIKLLGGIHTLVERNLITARDSTATNGLAGIHYARTAGDVIGSTIFSRHNYIAAGKQYGILCDRSPASSVFELDIVEFCDVGFRFNAAGSNVLLELYTEQIATTPIEMVDSINSIVGHLRDEPTVTWSGTAAADRFLARVGRNFIGAGKGLIFGGSTSGTDPTTSPSIRAGSGSPEGAQTAVVGSIWLRTNGAGNTTLYVKESGTGNTGWVAK